jgi:nitronate monooxygenase
MSKEFPLNKQLGISFPLVMAPMFLVSKVPLLKAGMEAGIMATFPTLNYRKEEDLRQVLIELNTIRLSAPQGNYGVNLIVQKSNPFYTKHLAVCVEQKVPFYITSLGNPKTVIDAAHSYGAVVYCDVTNLEHADKCVAQGCDGFIAVGQGAGGHAGPHPLQVLIPALKEKYPHIPVLAAGGITGGASLLSVMALGADGASIGTRFIVSKECDVKEDYKTSILGAGMDDIVLTTKISGTPCNVVNTEAAKKMGYEQNFFEKWMSNNPRTKKWFKMLVQARGMKKFEESLLPNRYLQLWSAGKSSALIHEELSVAEIVEHFKKEYYGALEKINATR